MQQNINNTQPLEEDEIDLKELFATIWNNKFKIAFFSFIVVSMTLIYVLKQPNSYQSKTILLPQGGSKAVGGGLSALAGMAGVDLGSSGASPNDMLEFILNDFDFHKSVIEKYKLKEKLESETIEEHYIFALGYSGIYDFFKSDSNNSEDKSEKTLFELYQEIKSIVSLSSDKKSGAITLTATHQDRFLAKDMVEIYLVELTNKLKEIDMEYTNESIKNFKRELFYTQNIELKASLSNMISEMIKNKVFSEANKYYLFKQVVKPIVADIKDKTKPKRGLILVVSFVTSIILGIFGIFFIEFIKGNKEENL